MIILTQLRTHTRKYHCTNCTHTTLPTIPANEESANTVPMRMQSRRNDDVEHIISFHGAFRDWFLTSVCIHDHYQDTSDMEMPLLFPR